MLLQLQVWAFLLLQAVAILWSPNTASALEYPPNESPTRLLKKLAGQIKKLTAGVTIRISRRDADPFTWKSV